MFLLLSGKQQTQGGQTPHLNTAPGTLSRGKWDSVPEHLKLPKIKQTGVITGPDTFTSLKTLEKHK